MAPDALNDYLQHLHATDDYERVTVQTFDRREQRVKLLSPDRQHIRTANESSLPSIATVSL